VKEGRDKAFPLLIFHVEPRLPPRACTMRSSAARACCAFLAAASSRSALLRPVQARWRLQRRVAMPASVLLVREPPIHAKPDLSSFHPLRAFLSHQNRAAVHVEHLAADEPASGVHRNSTGPATSRVLATRPSGIPAGCSRPALGPNRRCRHLRRHPSGRHAIHADTPRRQLARQALGKTNQGAFGHGIIRVMRLAPLPRGRADENDVAPVSWPFASPCPSLRVVLASICLSNWARRLHQPKHRVEVHAHRLPPLRFRHARDRHILMRQMP